MDESNRKYTAFGCELGFYEFKVMPMGLCNASATFQRMMNKILQDHIDKFLIVYMDDILVYSQTLEEHEEHLRLVFEKLEQNGLKVKFSKCDVYKKQIKYLGHLVSHGEIEPDPEKIEALYQFKLPKRLVQVQSFLGLANYYRKFIKNFGTVASSLYAVKENDGKLE
jgi:hypothetical protein